MTRLYGRAPRGQRLVAAVPHGHWKTSTFLGALREDGLVAPGVFEGAINGRSFLAYVRQVLVPVLRPDDIVIMDTLVRTRSQASARPSRRPGRSSSICRPTALI